MCSRYFLKIPLPFLYLSTLLTFFHFRIEWNDVYLLLNPIDFHDLAVLMGLVRPLRHVTALCGACLQSGPHRTMTETWRNPTFASAADPHVCTQQRLGHISSLTRVVTSQFLRVKMHARRDASSRSDFKSAQTNTRNLTPVSGRVNFAKVSVHCSAHFTPAPFKHLPPRYPPSQKKSFQTPMRHGLLSHPSDSQALNGTCRGSACPRTKDNCDLDKHWVEGRET